MKKSFLVTIISAAITVIALSAHSRQAGDRMHAEHHTMHGDGMPAHCMHHEMMIVEIMETVNAIMGIQQKIISGASSSERKELREKLSTMMENMSARIAAMRAMMHHGEAN